MSYTVLFVCTGNVCRSPMAAALFNQQARSAGESDWVTARSAGTWAMDGQPASGFAMNVMAERGLDLKSHRARTLTDQDIQNADLIIVMSRGHRDALIAEFPEVQNKLHLISELSGQIYDIPDPYGGPLSEYRNCALLLSALVEGGYDQIKSWLTPNPT